MVGVFVDAGQLAAIKSDRVPLGRNPVHVNPLSLVPMIAPSLPAAKQIVADAQVTSVNVPLDVEATVVQVEPPSLVTITSPRELFAFAPAAKQRSDVGQLTPLRVPKDDDLGCQVCPPSMVDRMISVVPFPFVPMMKQVELEVQSISRKDGTGETRAS